MALRPDQVARLPRLYHLTPAENLESVLRAGLRPGGAPSQFEARLLRRDCVYLADERNVAAQLMGEDDVMWGDAVVSLDPGALDPARFRADEDYWRGDAMSRGIGSDAASILAHVPGIDEPDQVARQFADLARIAYAGTIPAALLRLDFLWPRQDLPGQAALRAQVRGAPHFGAGVTAPALLSALAKRWRWGAWERAELGLRAR